MSFSSTAIRLHSKTNRCGDPTAKIEGIECCGGEAQPEGQEPALALCGGLSLESSDFILVKPSADHDLARLQAQAPVEAPWWQEVRV